MLVATTNVYHVTVVITLCNLFQFVDRWKLKFSLPQETHLQATQDEDASPTTPDLGAQNNPIQEQRPTGMAAQIVSVKDTLKAVAIGQMLNIILHKHLQFTSPCTHELQDQSTQAEMIEHTEAKADDHQQQKDVHHECKARLWSTGADHVIKANLVKPLFLLGLITTLVTLWLCRNTASRTVSHAAFEMPDGCFEESGRIHCL